ncbi:Ig-like domain-containing protein [Nocardiopsis rhodophaea]|uniref:Ig-like domain-containing protein n=1 Tax=Nocardiopsis rhodophaea TaxID=280238 RepID=UPI0031D131BC
MPTTQQFTATTDQDQDVTADAEWSSSDTGVVTVDASGVATAVAPGEATITATYRGLEATAEVTVTEPAPESLNITPDAAELEPAA